MYAPAFGRSPPEEGPFLVARHYGTPDEQAESHGDTNTSGVRGVHTGEDEDDSLAVVFSADTGAGRAHTPQRMNRTHTPQRWANKNSSLVRLLTLEFKCHRTRRRLTRDKGDHTDPLLCMSACCLERRRWSLLPCVCIVD